VLSGNYYANGVRKDEQSIGEPYHPDGSSSLFDDQPDTKASAGNISVQATRGLGTNANQIGITHNLIYRTI
jgi:hypothetical protein